MAELAKKLHFKKTGLEQTTKAYSTIVEAGTSYGTGGIGGIGGVSNFAGKGTNGSSGSNGWVIIEYGGDI